VVWTRCPKRRRGARPTPRTEEEARKMWGRSGRSGRVEMRLQGPSPITFPMPPSAHMAVGSRAAAPLPSATMPLRPESRRHALPPREEMFGTGRPSPTKRSTHDAPLGLVVGRPFPWADRAASSEVAKARLQSPDRMLGGQYGNYTPPRITPNHCSSETIEHGNSTALRYGTVRFIFLCVNPMTALAGNPPLSEMS
jgi:hypothetical protein